MNHSTSAIESAKGSTWDLDYYAAAKDWAGVGIAISQTRDSDTVEKSNWIVTVEDFIERFGAKGDGYIFGKGEHYAGGDIAVASLNHWAVGWVEFLVFNTEREDIALAVADIHVRLERYPVLDDEHHSKLEWEKNHPDTGYYAGKCLDPDCEHCGLEKA